MAQMMGLKVTGLKKTQHLVNNLTKNVKFETMDEAVSFLRDVRKAMKIRVPVSSGDLKKGIGEVERRENYARIVISSGHLLKQEEGKGLPYRDKSFTPKKKLHKPGSIIKQGFVKGGKGVIVRRYTPFVKPALESQINKLPQRLSKATNKAINKSKK